MSLFFGERRERGRTVIADAIATELSRRQTEGRVRVGANAYLVSAPVLIIYIIIARISESVLYPPKPIHSSAQSSPYNRRQVKDARPESSPLPRENRTERDGDDAVAERPCCEGCAP